MYITLQVCASWLKGVTTAYYIGGGPQRIPLDPPLQMYVAVLFMCTICISIHGCAGGCVDV